MSAKPRKIPSYRLHKPTRQAFVRLDGRDDYLGRHGTDASREAYNRKVAEWLTAGSPARAKPHSAEVPPAATDAVSVAELILGFMTRHASTHYRRVDGTPTDEIENFKQLLRPPKKLYGLTPAGEFGP